MTRMCQREDIILVPPSMFGKDDGESGKGEIECAIICTQTLIILQEALNLGGELQAY